MDVLPVWAQWLMLLLVIFVAGCELFRAAQALRGYAATMVYRVADKIIAPYNAARDVAAERYAKEFSDDRNLQSVIHAYCQSIMDDPESSTEFFAHIADAFVALMTHVSTEPELCAAEKALRRLFLPAYAAKLRSIAERQELHARAHLVDAGAGELVALYEREARKDPKFG